MNLDTLRTLIMEHAETYGVRPDSVTLSPKDATAIHQQVLAGTMFAPSGGHTVETFMGVRIEESARVTTPVLS